MSVGKSNFTTYATLLKASGVSRPTNIVDLMKRNKEEEKREKIQKIYAPLSFIGLILLLGIFLL